jgi:phosphoglycolate phosphatase
MSYKVVIYDCDGVMFDSFEANLEFYQRIMTLMGKSHLDRTNNQHMRILHTYSHREVLAHFFPDAEEWHRAVQHAAEIDYRDLVPLMKVEEGFLEALKLLQHHLKLAVCTNRSSSMDMVLDHFHLGTYFNFVMTASKVANPKPHPEPLLKVLEHFAIAPTEALFVGDSEVDCLAASAADVPFVSYKADLPAISRIDHHSQLFDLLNK